MYREFYGLRDRPFDLTPNPRYLVLTEGHREALSNLQYGIAARKGLTLLVGESGTGKTTVIRAALERQSDQVHCVHINNPALTRAEFVQTLAVRFALSEAAQGSKAILLAELEQLLRDRRDRDESSVLIIDEAQSLPEELLEEIRLLANIETNDEKLLSVVVAGQPELAERLNQPSLRQFKQRVALRCALRPLSQTETFAYVAGRIRAAGGTGARLFTREAVALLHDRSEGIPRLISVMADNALVSGFATGQRPVGTSVIEEVCRDLDLGRHPAGAPKGPAPTSSPSPSPGDESSVLVFDATSPSSPPATGDTTTILVAAPGTTKPAAAPEPGPATTTPGPSADLFGTFTPRRRRFFFFPFLEKLG